MRLRSLFPLVATTSVMLSACSADSTTATLAPSTPSYITDGAVDGSGHPAVVLILMDVGGAPAYRCSGTLISPTVVLTAGHCAGEPGEFSGVRIFTESDVQNGDNNYPYPGPN